MFGFVAGVAALSGTVYWLYRSKQAAVSACVQALGCARVGEKNTRQGQTAEGLAFWERLLARGTCEGSDVEVWERQVRRAIDVKYRKSRGTTLTVLELKPPSPPVCEFRLQPAGVMGLIEAFTQGVSEPAPTGDASFDAAFKLYASSAAGALAVLTAELRRDLLDFRRAVAGDVATMQSGNLAVSLVLGSFEIRPDRVAVAVFGTPSRKVGEQLRRAAPLLARMCEPGMAPPVAQTSPTC